MTVDIRGAKILFTLPIFGGIRITETQVNTWILIAFITLVRIWLTHDLKVRPTSKRQVVAEWIVEALNNLVRSNMTEKFLWFTPFIGALFALSAVGSLSSLVGLYPITADYNTECGWAIMVFVLITFYKLKTNGVGGYLKGFTEPIAVLTPFNIISEISTPISMSFRHFGNIASGTVISTLVYAALATLSHAVLKWLPGFLASIPVFQLGVPAILSVYFDLFGGILQAYIFCMLTMLYISSAAGYEPE